MTPPLRSSGPSNLEASRQLMLRLCPAFSQAIAESLYANDQGELTEHGLWSEFSHFFNENAGLVAAEGRAELFGFIESVVAADPEDRDVSANAICTCFLENIAGTPAGEASRQLMGPSSRAFFDRWNI